MQTTPTSHTFARRSRRALAASALAVAIAGLTGVAPVPGSSASAAQDAAIYDTAAIGNELTPSIRADLLYMRQEEKLAGDVYAALGEQWNLPVFANIERAELRHQSQVAAMMERFGIDDPVAELAPGEFIDPDLQRLYDDLVARGSTSEVEALRVGALIEELDIADLRARVSGQAELDALYARLEAGSHNHLRAFVRNLERRGESYTPVILGHEDFEAILAGSQGRGPGQQAPGRRGRFETDRQVPDAGERRGPGRPMTRLVS